MNYFSKFATDKYRWLALVFLSLGLAIVIIDNTVLNVAIPYILRDLHTSLDSLQWVVSGYALIIATLLILMGRLGDIFGRKKIFLVGCVLFAIGSTIASFAHSSTVLFIGEALIEALGAAAMMTSSLALLVSEFKGRERPIAFGVWGSVAGASATLGPILGGYFTTYHSWRWSLRINVVVALVAILGSIFIQESKGEQGKKFDIGGALLSGLGLFFLVFGFIEGRKYGWWHSVEQFSLYGWHLSFGGWSVIPVAFLLSVLFLVIFTVYEGMIVNKGVTPILRLSLFRSWGFSMGLVTLMVISLGQFGVFFILPVFLQTVLGLNAIQTGVVFLSSSITVMVVGPLSGYIASRINPKWVVTIGMIASCIGTYWLGQLLSTSTTGWSLAPAFIFFGIGIGATSAQLTNIILSGVPHELAGEASAVNTTMRQVGTSIGIAILGTVLASSVISGVKTNIQNDRIIPPQAKSAIIASINEASVESGQQNQTHGGDLLLSLTIKNDVNQAMVDGSRRAMSVAFWFVLAGTLISFLIPKSHSEHKDETVASTH